MTHAQLFRHALVHCQAFRYQRPFRFAARHDGVGRAELRGVVERAGIDVWLFAQAQLAAKHQAFALWADVYWRAQRSRRPNRGKRRPGGSASANTEAMLFREFPPDRIEFGREAFAADPRLVAIRWQRA